MILQCIMYVIFSANNILHKAVDNVAVPATELPGIFGNYITSYFISHILYFKSTYCNVRSVREQVNSTPPV